MRKIAALLLLLLLSTPVFAQQFQNAGWPTNATPIIINSANAANATLTVSIPNAPGTWNYLTGASCTSNGATASSYVSATITGIIGGTITAILFVPINTSAGNIVPLGSAGLAPIKYPWPASAVNTAITLSVPALGTGNSLTRCTLEGFSVPVSIY